MSPTTTYFKVQSVQNAATRQITWSGRREHITPILHEIQKQGSHSTWKLKIHDGRYSPTISDVTDEHVLRNFVGSSSLHWQNAKPDTNPSPNGHCHLLTTMPSRHWLSSTFENRFFGHHSLKSRPIWIRFGRDLVLHGMSVWLPMGNSWPNKNDFIFVL